MNGPVLVTGATGFLGREIVAQLLASGVETHAFARPGAERPGRAEFAGLAAPDLAWHEGDLLDEASVERAVAAVAGLGRALAAPARIVHSAALISYRTRDRALAREVNVQGTARLLAAARRHAIGRFLFVSSVVTVGACRGADPIDETADFDLGALGVDYVDTKRAAEELVLASARDLDVVVVNPGAIFGPVERRSNTVRFIRRTAQGRPPPFAPPGSISVVGVRDAARGTILALEKGRRGERYLLVESSMSALELFGRIAGAVGVEPVTRVLPRPAFRLLRAAAVLWDAVFPMRTTPPQALAMLAQDLRFDARKARRELGWSPEPFERVLADTVRHLGAKGLLAGGPPA